MELAALFQDVRQKFLQEGLETPDLDARLIIAHHAKLNHADFIINKGLTLSQEVMRSIQLDVVRRLAGEPVSRILGVREFWGLEFEVTPETLDPRADTETLVEAALRFSRASLKDKPSASCPAACGYGDLKKRGRDNEASFRILDLGTGTGCISIALLSELPHATAVAVDFSYQATLIAQRNAKKHGLEGRFSIIQGDWMEALKVGAFDLIVSNPPYIPNPDIEILSKDVKNHDPLLALSGGKDGLDCYKKIIFALKKHLNGENRAFLEIGFGQLEDLSRLVDDSGLQLCDSKADIAGIPRVVEISRGDK